MVYLFLLSLTFGLDLCLSLCISTFQQQKTNVSPPQRDHSRNGCFLGAQACGANDRRGACADQGIGALMPCRFSTIVSSSSRVPPWKWAAKLESRRSHLLRPETLSRAVHAAPLDPAAPFFSGVLPDLDRGFSAFLCAWRQIYAIRRALHFDCLRGPAQFLSCLSDFVDSWISRCRRRRHP